MLNKFTLAAFAVLGAASISGMSATQASAHNLRLAGYVEQQAAAQKVYHHRRYNRRVWRVIRFGHDRRPARFINRVRQGHVVCYRTIRRPQMRRQVRNGYRYYHSRGWRLDARTVGRLIRAGRGNVLRCFTR